MNDGIDTDDGLVHALLFHRQGGARPIGWDEVREWRPEQGLLWVHIGLGSEPAREWVAQRAGIPTVAEQGLLAEETRPRTVAIGAGVLIQLRGVNLNPGANPEDMVSIRLWVEADRIVSTRIRPLLSVRETAEAALERPPADVGELLATLIDRLTGRMANVIDDLEDRVADLEQRAVDAPDHTMRNELADLRREAITLRRFLSPQREALSRLYAEPLPWLNDTCRMRLREANDRLLRYLEDLDAARDRAAVVQEELMSMLSEQLNSRMYVLSIVAAIFLPLGFFTGLLGINVGGIPGTESPWGFVIVSLLLVVVVVAQVFYLRRRKWF